MLVVISDLHLQDTRFDGVRRRTPTGVRETVVERNVSAAALGLLFSEVAANVDRMNATAVELVLAGDIFEMHRTPQWLLGGSSVRPYLHPAVKSEALERTSLGILDGIAAECADFFSALGKFVKTGEFERSNQTVRVAVPIRVHFVPGNHDRLVDLWPSTRRRVRELLAMDAAGSQGEAPFPHQLNWEEYGAFVRHGHEYDSQNFPVDFQPEAPPADEVYARPVVGDYVTIDIATRIASAFRAHFAKELRADGADGDRFRRLYAALTEFDDVRPASSLGAYLVSIGASEKETFGYLRPILRDVFETARADSFFLAEAHRLGFESYFRGPISAALDIMLKEFSASSLSKVVGMLTKIEGQARPATMAAREPCATAGTTLAVIAGHTHEPDHVAIATQAGRAGYFLDSGTWRTRIDAGVGAFGRLRSYTMIFCYGSSEIKASAGTGDQERRNFETWTGHLLSDQYGPQYDRPTEELPLLPAQGVRFLECRVRHIDEGHTADGGELELHFGVDGASRTERFDGVHDGDVLKLAGVALLADPALDGDIWCWGLEKDLGNILDADDPMPWALDVVPRDAESRFLEGERTLEATDNQGNSYTLVYEVG